MGQQRCEVSPEAVRALKVMINAEEASSAVLSHSQSILAPFGASSHETSLLVPCIRSHRFPYALRERAHAVHSVSAATEHSHVDAPPPCEVGLVRLEELIAGSGGALIDVGKVGEEGRSVSRGSGGRSQRGGRAALG